MFNREKRTLTLQGKEEPIERFVVMFQTPFGLFDGFDQAIQRLVADDMDINLCIKPVAVAITATLYEVIG